MDMQFLDAAQVEALLDYPLLIETMKRDLGSAGIAVPLRSSHVMHVDATGADTLLTMPAWNEGGTLGVKLVTVRGSSRKRTGATVNAVYLLFDPDTGAPVACLDGEALTRRRTAAISALAASLLARPDAAHLLMVGTGTLASDIVQAHCAVRSFNRVSIWGRNRDAAQDKADALRKLGIETHVARDLERAVGEADIVCCATTAREPVVVGRWLRSGQHLDLTGGFRPDMREVDEEAIVRSELFVDTRDGALVEAGEIVQAIANGSIAATHIAGTLAELCRGSHPGRSGRDAITVFKSVGTAAADLVAGTLALRRTSGPGATFGQIGCHEATGIDFG